MKQKYILLIYSFALIISIKDSICSNNENQSYNIDEEKSHSTSVAGMTQLLKLEKNLIKNLNNYVKALENKAAIIRSAIKKLWAENKKSINNTEAYLSNPLNGFSLIRRMHSDWLKWQEFMTQPIGAEQVNFIESMRPNLPTNTDLTEAAEAIHRIQTTYDMAVKDIVVGLLNGKQYDVQLSAPDCFAIGMHLYKAQKYVDASFWFHIILDAFRDSDVYKVFSLNRTTLLEMYSDTLLKLNRRKDALSVLDIALTDKPAEAGKLLQRKNDIENMIKTQPALPIITKTSQAGYHELGCRGAFRNQISRLQCRYNYTTSPFTRLAPIKMEEVKLEPYMVLYHDIIYDNEIVELKKLARPSLKRATVYNAALGRSVPVSTRTSKVAWFFDNYNDLVKRINRRISDMTGFDMYGSEMIQVMNYGLGGHYETHYDFFNLTEESDLMRMNGDRIATVLFYLSNVEEGGATVFPNIQTAIFPKKGSAIMWYNLNNAIAPDWRTMHAACPVIVGSKWVCNKWIRHKQQIFRRPCYK